ncbi:MAG: hypothetical protein GY870_00630 [archaeon]|nr:hypothetical protein [archaeon]
MIAEKLQVNRFNINVTLFRREEENFQIYRTLAVINSIILLDYNQNDFDILIFIGIMTFILISISISAYLVIRNIIMKKRTGLVQ